MTTKILLLTIITTLLIFSAFSKDNKKAKNLPTFQEYKERFQKQYATSEQQSYRKTVYNKNRKQIIQNTECQDCGMNVFSDKTQEQRRNQLFGLQIPENFEQIMLQSHHKVKSKLQSSLVSFPTSLDWRQKNAVSKVRSQGSCGACWAFQMTAAAQSLLIIQGKGNASTIDLSEQGLLECTSGSSCSGGYPSKAAQLIISGGGMYNETKYPYRPSSFYKGSICNATSKKDFASPAKSSSDYYGISDAQIIEYLQVSPIGVTIDADSLSSKYDPTKNTVHKCSVSDNQINHGVLLVGYTPTYWIIKNSWGTKWGIDGFAYISRNRANNQNCVIQTWITVLEPDCMVPYCSVCSAPTSCSICQSGYYQSQNGSDYSCQACIDKNCQTCYTKAQNAALQGRCKVCKQGFSLQASSQACKNSTQLNIPNCLVHSSDFSTCQTCDDGYVISSDATKCLKCAISNCQQCMAGYTNRCKSCAPGYSGDSCQMICSDKCQGGCTKPGICTNCMKGYSGKNCQIIQCDDNCQSCSVPYTCDKCDPGFVLPNCDPDKSQQVTCSQYVQNCIKGCSTNKNICDQCDPNYYGPQCNIQYICDSLKCQTIVNTFKATINSVQQSSSNSVPQTKSTQAGQNSSNTAFQDSSERTGLIIALTVLSFVLVLSFGFAAFLIYRLRTIKTINIIEPLQSEGSNKSIPYVGKKIPL